MKKIYFTLVVLVMATIAMAYFYFTNLETKNNANELSLIAITNRCGLVFSFENDKSFYEILGGQALLQQTLGDRKSKQLKNLNVFVKNRSIFGALEGQKTYIGINAENDEVNFLIATQVKAGADAAQLLQSMKSKKFRKTASGDTYQLDFVDSTVVFLSIRKDLILISNSINEIVPPEKKQKSNDFALFIQDNSRFNKNTLANLFINFERIPSILNNIIATSVNGELNVFHQQKTYAALSYSFSKNKLLFNGTTKLDDAANYYRLFVNLPAQHLAIDNVFPSNTANYVAFGIDGYQSWHKLLDQWMTLNQKKEKVKKQVSKIEQQYRVNLQEILPKYFKNQFATFQLQTGEKFGAVALTNGEKVNQLLLDISANYAPGIKIFKEPLIPFVYFGKPFEKFERPFYTIVDNFLVIANNASSIQSFLRSYQSNSLLTNDQNYIEFKEQLSSESNICFYVNNKNSNEVLSRSLKRQFYKQYRSNSGFKSYHAFCYQLVGDNGKFLTNLLLSKNQEKPAVADTTTSEQ